MKPQDTTLGNIYFKVIRTCPTVMLVILPRLPAMTIDGELPLDGVLLLEGGPPFLATGTILFGGRVLAGIVDEDLPPKTNRGIRESNI